MALDERYREVHDVTDVHEREKQFGVGLENGNVIVTCPTWFKVSPRKAFAIADSIRAVAMAATADEQRGS